MTTRKAVQIKLNDLEISKADAEALRLGVSRSEAIRNLVNKLPVPNQDQFPRSKG
jgi:hypothetical protein